MCIDFLLNSEHCNGPFVLKNVVELAFPTTPSSRKWLFLTPTRTPLHWHLVVWKFLNKQLPLWWTRHEGVNYLALYPWLPHSPDLIVCNFFLWDFIKDKVCMFQDFKETKTQFATTADEITNETLQFHMRKVWISPRCVSYSLRRPY